MSFSSTCPMYDMSRTNISVSFKRIKIMLQLLLSLICASLGVGLLLQLHMDKLKPVSNSEQENGKLSDVFRYLAIIIYMVNFEQF